VGQSILNKCAILFLFYRGFPLKEVGQSILYKCHSIYRLRGIPTTWRWVSLFVQVCHSIYRLRGIPTTWRWVSLFVQVCHSIYRLRGIPTTWRLVSLFVQVCHSIYRLRGIPTTWRLDRRWWRTWRPWPGCRVASLPSRTSPGVHMRTSKTHLIYVCYMSVNACNQLTTDLYILAKINLPLTIIDKSRL